VSDSGSKPTSERANPDDQEFSMRHACLFMATILATLLGAGATGCSGSGDAGLAPATPSASAADSATVATQSTPDSTQAPSGAPATWPPDLQLPNGIALLGTPVQTADGMSATLSCSGKASTALTGLTAMLNNAGYKTNWRLPAGDASQIAILKGSARGKNVRAQFNVTAEGVCHDVAFSVSD